MCRFARAETYVILHNIGSYTRVAMILYVYTCEYMYVYKIIQEVLSVSVYKGRSICGI